jgi:signal transduction histidine kinase
MALVDLNEVLREVIADLEHRIREQKARIEIDRLPTINADRSQLHRLFLNLVGNALKFQAEGNRPWVRVKLTKIDRKHVEIQVSDNGIGFEEKYLDRIFRPFQRLHGRGQYQGTGMGLAICKKIVENHHGEISARSTPGEGTNFSLTLPL